MACFVGASKNIDDYATTSEAFTCLRKLNSLLGEELCAFLRTQILPKHFPSIDNNNDELLALILLSDMKTSKKALKQALMQFRLLDAT